MRDKWIGRDRERERERKIARDTQTETPTEVEDGRAKKCNAHLAPLIKLSKTKRAIRTTFFIGFKLIKTYAPLKREGTSYGVVVWLIFSLLRSIPLCRYLLARKMHFVHIRTGVLCSRNKFLQE